MSLEFYFTPRDMQLKFNNRCAKSYSVPRDTEHTGHPVFAFGNEERCSNCQQLGEAKKGIMIKKNNF